MSFLVSALGAFGLVLFYAGLTGAEKRNVRGPLGARFDRLAEEAGMTAVSGRRLLLAACVLATITFLVAAGVTSSTVVALAIAAPAAYSPFALAIGRRHARRKRFRDAWPDAIATLIAGIRAGVSLPECCAAAGERGPESLRSGWHAFASTYRATGSFSAGLESMQSHLADPVADRVAVALRLANDVGGTDLVRVLRALGDFVRDDLRVRREIESRWSWTVSAARVAAAAPWLVLLMMSLRPEAAAAYESASGALVIGIGAAVTLLGYRTMLRIARLPEDRRLLG